MKKNMYLEVGVVVVLTCVLVSCAAPAQVAAPALPAPATEMVAPNAISAPAPGESPIIDNMRKYGKVRAGVAIAQRHGSFKIPLRRSLSAHRMTCP